MAFVDTKTPTRPRGLEAKESLTGRNGPLAFISTCVKVAIQRHQLRQLDDRMLKDIGISRADVEREAGRHFFDLPKRKIKDR